MFRPRVIPILLLKNLGLVKSVKFKDYNYIGDPINAVKLFNDMKADELVFLDILATKESRTVSLEFVRNVGEEANMPFSVGGGIRTINDIREIINAGAEKVVINSYAIENPDFISQAADTFGSSTIVVSIDVKRNLFGKQQIYGFAGTKAAKFSPLEFALLMQEKGAGEIIVNSIERDGMMVGYDIMLIKQIADTLTIPVVAVGGAGTLNDFKQVVSEGHASAVAAGSMFVYYGPRKAVLINYPSREELTKLFG